MTTLIVGSERTRSNIVTEDMVRTLAKEAVGEGVLDPVEAQYINHIFDLGNKTVAEVMTPRSRIFFLPADMPLPMMVQQLHRTRRTKVPVYDGNRDTILGILYARDLLGLDTAAIAATPGGLQRLLREPYYVPESEPAADLFHQFRRRRLSLALAMDENGEMTGLITMEDLLECFWRPVVPRMAAGMEYRSLQRRLRIAAVCRSAVHSAVMSAFRKQGPETVAGLVLERLGELPSVRARWSWKQSSPSQPSGTTIQELSVSAV
jgi:putative hemolysin